MAIEVKIPSVGESITSGVVSAWHKKSGEFVNEGEALFTLETDKVSTEIVAEKAGVLETKVPEGQEVKIGEVVAIIDDSKGTPAEKKEEKPQKKEPEKKETEAEPEKKAAEEKAPVAADDRGKPQPTAAATAPLSPAVRRIVEEEKLRAGENSRHRRRRAPDKRRCPGCSTTARQSGLVRRNLGEGGRKS